jgi:hypothetical protein
MHGREDLARQVTVFVAERMGIPVEQINPDSRLLHDLRIDGDDADELLEEFFRRFDVHRGRFDFSRFFNGEAGIEQMIALFTRDRSRLLEREPLRVSDLVNAARERRFWV